MQISIQEERLPLAQVGSWLTDSAAAQSFSAKISKVFTLLDTTAGERTSGLSRRELFTLLAITHGLDLLNIGSLGFALLPLSSTRNDQKSQAATVYRQQQPAIYAPHSPNAEITWLANALLTALSETPQTSFRFLQILTCPQSGEQPLEVVLAELTLANDKAMVRLQTNIDDMSPQLLNHAINQLFAASQQITMDEPQLQDLTPIRTNSRPENVGPHCPNRRNKLNKEADFIKEYTGSLNEVLNALPADKFIEINKILLDARETGKQILVIGNGGSGAAASHMVCDFNKNTREEGKKRMRAICLNDNIPSILAYANDEGYDIIFSEQVLSLGRPGDVLIAISGSGNSANILKGIQAARQQLMQVVGLTGFAGGKMKEMCDVCLVVPCDSMEMIEDVHLIINHILAGLLRGAVMYGK
jgi:D-sedoheptulose 7-phosphate isomerase